MIELKEDTPIVKQIEQDEKDINDKATMFGKHHPEIAKSLFNIAYKYYTINEHTHALQYYQRALQISKSNHQGLDADIYYNMALSYQFLTNYDLAMKCLVAALDIEQKARINNCNAIADIKHCIANVYNSMGKYQLAIECFENRIKLPNTSPYAVLGDVYFNLGNSYSTLNEHTKANDFYTYALQVYGSCYAMNQIDIADVHLNIGNQYYKLKDYKKALKQYHKSLSIRVKLLGGHNAEVADANYNIGLALKAKGCGGRAIKSLMTAAQIYFDFGIYDDMSCTYELLLSFEKITNKNYVRFLQCYIEGAIVGYGNQSTLVTSLHARMSKLNSEIQT